MKSYKETLLIPSTKFEMRGNLVQKDPFYIKKAIEDNLFNKVNDQNNGFFVLHDGPPYANGSIHLGHALNKILKDIFVRHNSLNGLKVEWILGWDTHGLPIENAVQKEGKITQETTREQALKAFRNFALTQQQNQLKQFKKLALFTDFDKKYLTLENNYVSKELEVFFEMFNKGLIYRDLKPVYWSWSSHTALAEAEIIYKDIESNSIYVAFPLENNSDLNILIWTTTPWTLLVNVAVAFGKNIKYSIYEINSKKYIIAEELVSSLEEHKKSQFKHIQSINIEDYLGKNVINPINGNLSKIVLGHHVTIESGTGIVHIAGGHGEDDFLIVKENQLPLKVALNETGQVIVEGKFKDKFYQDVEADIISDLKKQGNLFYFHKFKHAYPHDWRTKEPLFFLATKQWFVSLKAIRSDLLDAIKNVRWEPKWGEKRLSKMIEDRDDWCISRQRLWGVPIPIIFDENKTPITNSKLEKVIISNIAKNGTIWWYDTSLEEILKEADIKFNPNYTKETDILDVWFDSGSSNYVNYQDKDIDLIVEGTDQYRGWFNSSLITGFVTRNKAPYNKVISHGFVLDSEGQKMSKSLGNVVDPLEVIKKYGIDILRLWVSSSDYKDNLKISNDILEQAANDYKKLRNTLRFLLGNIETINMEEVNLSLIDKIVLTKLNELLLQAKDKYDIGNINSIIKELVASISTGFISFYLDYSKDILYTYEKNDWERKAIVYVMQNLFHVISYLLAPILPITIEEAYGTIGDKQSIFLEKFDFKHLENYKFHNQADDLFSLKSQFNKAFEQFRQAQNIKKSLEVEINLSLPSSFSLLDEKLIANALMVARVNIISNHSDLIDIEIVKNPNLIKCQRCWKFFLKDEMANENICIKCDSVLKNNRKR